MTAEIARRAMIDSQLRPEGVNDRTLLAAFAAVDRAAYVPESRRAMAYKDRAIDLGYGEAMIPTSALAKLIQRAAPVPGETALVFGPGGDYAAAVLEALGVAASTANADAKSRKASADIVLIAGAVEILPDGLAAALSDNGRIVCGLVDRGVTRLAEGRKIGKALALTSFADAQIPVLPAYRRAPAFAF